MTKALLTGASGFIGRHCIPLLQERGYEVHAITSMSIQRPSSGIFWHQLDLLDTQQLIDIVSSVKPTHLVHLAWYAVPGEFWCSEKNYAWVSASLRLIEEFARHGGQRVVMAGSCAEYDWRYGYCSESLTPPAQNSIYGSCKHALYLLFQSYCETFDISGAWARIFSVYGPHEHPSRLVASVINSLIRGSPAPCTSGDQIRDYLHVVDVAKAFVMLLDGAVTGAVNIGSGKPVSVESIVCTIADCLGRQDLLRIGAINRQVKEPPLIVADNQRLVNEVSWTPAYNIESGIADTTAFWKTNISPETPNE